MAKVDFIAEQEEKVFIELSNSKLATLGVEPAQIFQTLAAQNAVVASGVFDTATDRVFVRPSGAFDSLDAIRDIAIRANDRVFRLGDIARVYRGYVDPPQQQMRWQGREALGIGVTMAQGGDVIELGHDLAREIARIQRALPVGVEIETVTSMPEAVQRSVNQFVRSLAEAVVIVLVVSLLSLGLRTGLVVAVSIPLVLAITFGVMWWADIGLHKISLGALILSLGLLVDDAIIAVEMMAIKIEQGFDRVRAASFTYTSTAFPMLTGTLVTVAGFLPIATARSSTGEYTRSIFQVSAIALIASWVVAVVVIPYLGYKMLPDPSKEPRPSLRARIWARLTGRAPPPARAVDHVDEDAVYRTPFYTRLRTAIAWCIGHRKTVLIATLALFVGALALFRFVPQQFFPASSRPELLVDLRLPEGSSFAATLSEAKKMEAVLAAEPGVEHFIAYVGAGSPRFYLPLDQQLTQSNFAQFVLVAKDNAERERIRDRLLTLFANDFPALRGRVSRLENGPPVGIPGAVSRVGRGHRHRAPACAGSRGDHAPRPGHARRPVRLGRADEGDPPRHRPEQGAAPRRVFGRPRGVPQQLAVGARRHELPRGRQADRRRAARRGRRARADELPQGPRDPVEERQGGADHAGRRRQVRPRGRHRVAPQPAADDHGARRRTR